MRGDAAGDVLAEPGREHDGADGERDEEGVDKAVLLQEPVQPLVAAHPQHVAPVQVDVERAAHPAEDADEGEDEQLHGVEGEGHLEGGHEHGHDGLLLLREDGEQAEDQGAADGGKEPAPVVPHGEVDRGDLDAEEDAAHGRAEAAGDADGARRRQHLAVARLVGVDASKDEEIVTLEAP